MVNLGEILNPQVRIQASRLRDVFARARPFKHLCMDGFLTPTAANQAFAEFPTDATVGEFYRGLYACLASQPFLDLLSEVTGIPELLADPNPSGSAMAYGEGEQMELSPPTIWSEGMDAWRRLNLAIYLNPEWQRGWGGAIELHSGPRSPDSTTITAFEPLFNRALLVETTESSWLGFSRIRLPPGSEHVTRKSISLSLYTRRRATQEAVPPQSPTAGQRPLLERLHAGYTLTAEDAAALRDALAKPDDSAAQSQKRELELRERLQSERKFLQEVMQNLQAPILGYGVQDGKLSGLYHDRWVAPRLELTIQPRLPVTSLTVQGWVPDQMPTGGELRLQIGSETAVKDFVPGLFSISVDIPGSTEDPIAMSIEATQFLTPEGPEGRKLAFVLRGIELGHAS